MNSIPDASSKPFNEEPDKVLQNKMAFVRARRKKPSHDEVIQKHIEERAAEVREMIGTFFEDIKNSFKDTKEVINDLKATVENQDFLMPANEQAENLRETIDELKGMQIGLEKILQRKEKELDELNEKKQHLANSIRNFKNKLKSMPKQHPYTAPLLQKSEDLNEYISNATKG